MGDQKVRIGIVGLGMVGTPVRRWFEERCGYRRGEDMLCFDTNPSLGCSDDVNEATIIFVCVPSPPNADGSCNTSIVRSVVMSIPDGRIVVIKSTVPPGTTQALQDERPGLKLMFCPEFLTESQAWEDFVKPARQLVGVTKQSMPHAVEILGMLPQALFQRPDAPVYGGREVVTATEAELAKYASNVFGAFKVVFANVLADFCDAMSKVTGCTVSYEHVREMLGADPRIGRAWLSVDHGSYNGFGGYCFPKDTAAFIAAFVVLAEKFKQKSVNIPRLNTLCAGIGFLDSMYSYNEILLAEQGLTIAEVSEHTKDIAIKEKRRTVRG